MRHPELRLGTGYQSPEYGYGPLDRDLLADDGAQHHLVFVPATRQSHAGPACLQTGEQRILTEQITDPLHIGIEIPHPAHPVEQIGQRRER